jgi:glutathione S-transferase
MKLYSAPGTCALATQIALTEAGAKFELVNVDLRGDRMLPDGRNFNDINPKGYVPVLELDDGTLITENIAVLQVVGDLFPAARLLPPYGMMERVRLQEWLAFVNSEVHKAFSHFFNPKLPEGMREILTERLHKRYAYLDKHFADHDYLLESGYSVADIYLYVVTAWAPKFKVDLSAYRAVAKWQARLARRDAIAAVSAARSG